jgi:hypothetical protein
MVQTKQKPKANVILSNDPDPIKIFPQQLLCGLSPSEQTYEAFPQEVTSPLQAKNYGDSGERSQEWQVCLLIPLIVLSFIVQTIF